MARKPAAAPKLDASMPLVVLHGKDDFLRQQYTAQLRTALEQAHGGPDAVQTVRFDGTTTPPADILDECRSFGLMTTYKLVLVDDADELLKAGADDAPAPRKGPRHAPKSARELFEAYAAEPSSSATLVLRASTWRPGKIDKAVDAAGGLVLKCEPLDPATAARWAVARCAKRHRASIDPKAAALLIDHVGTDLARIDSELAKLAASTDAADADTPPAITAEDVAAMVGLSREEEFWAIQQSLLAGDARLALEHLGDLLDVSRHDPVPIFFSCLDLARKLHLAARAVDAGAGPRDTAKAAGVWGPAAEVVPHAARALGSARCAALLHDAVELDAMSKSGRAAPRLALERLVLRFASARA